MPRLLERRWYGPRVFEIRLERDGWSFRPGDATLLVLPDRITARPYSLSGPPMASDLRVLVRRVPGGGVSEFLADCPLGTELGTTPPIPQLDLTQPEEMVWVATGTGISPFLSALRQDPKRPPRFLLYGVRFAEDVVERELLEGTGALRLHVSQGRLEGAFERRIRPDDVPVDSRLRYAICGHGELARNVLAYLRARGVPSERVQCEVFFP